MIRQRIFLESDLIEKLELQLDSFDKAGSAASSFEIVRADDANELLETHGQISWKNIL